MRIRIKAQLEEDTVPAGVENFTRERFAPNKELNLDDKQGKALVDGGFADQLDSRGYIVDPAAAEDAAKATAAAAKAEAKAEAKAKADAKAASDAEVHSTRRSRKADE